MDEDEDEEGIIRVNGHSTDLSTDISQTIKKQSEMLFVRGTVTLLRSLDLHLQATLWS